MDLDPGQCNLVKTGLKHVFAWLRASPKEKDQELGHPGLGLTDTPVVLLSSLAPGADQWAVSVAREVSTEPVHRAGVHVLAPLPFFKDQYLESSTFNRACVDESAKQFLANFPDEETFVVRFNDELNHNEAELRAKHRLILTGPDAKAVRDRRFLAAGEYVAAYSDILLALTDGSIRPIESSALIQRESPSAEAIAQRKLRGLMFGLLPTSPALGGSDNGAVIHIYAPRKPKRNDTSANAKTSKAGKLEILFPYEYCPDHLRAQNYSDKRWQKAGYAALFALAQNFQLLNTEQIAVRKEKEARALSELLPNAEVLLPARSDGNELGRLRDTLDHLARLRRRIADYNRYYDERIKRLKQTLFRLAFFSALFFALAESWVPTPDTGGPLRTFCFVAGVALTLAAWAIFSWHRARLYDQRSDDYRAIAEGLRVQFYWTACGSGESVASNYLQRQRGEIGWIRGVISAASFPYETMRSIFDNLSPDKRRALLGSIRKGWVQEQLGYFTSNVDKLTRQRAFFVHYSSIMLFSAFLLYIFNFIFQYSVLANLSSLNPSLLMNRSEAISLCGAAIAIVGILYGLSDFDFIDKLRTDELNSTDKLFQAPSKPRTFMDRIFASLFLVFSMFLPKRVESVRGGNYLLRGALVVAITILVVGSAYYVRGLGSWLPSPIKISSMLRNLLLAGGVLCGLWVSANHLTENIRRYASMESMFNGADERFGQYLAACDGNDPVVVQRVFDDIRSLIIAVGRESLPENADWLFTHRARPVEPVST
ncbi:MAG: hypothetical protein JO279_05160 [Verrucomicrobia bacterium]|nr:hypothetical protein [Verrucomicrobiota bacterium]